MTHDANPACSNGAPAPYDPSLKNILEFDDTTIHLGRYIAFLSTECHLLGRNGQKQAQQRTLNEFFLALQA